MEPASYPDASRLVYRIRAALKGESTGLEAAKLAWQFAEAVERVNACLSRCAAALDAGNPIDAALLEARHPRLLEAAAALDFEQWDAWSRRCQDFAWRQPPPIDKAAAERLRAALAAVEDPKEWLYQDYRDAARRKDSDRAWLVISAIAAKFPDDAQAQEEARRRKAALRERAKSQIAAALGELIPAEPPAAIVARYRAQGVELPSDPAIDAAIQADRDSRIAQFEASVRAAVEADQGLAPEGPWQEAEALYLKANYTLAIAESRGDISSELRDAFEKAATHLSRLRSAYESDVSIRLAIAELRAPRGRARADRKRPSRIVERLTSLETQARRMGRPISAELQRELGAAYALARRQRLPRWIALYGGLLALLAAALWGGIAAMKALQAKEAQAELLAAIHAARDASNFESARLALLRWKALAPPVKPDSELARSAAALEAWTEEQRALAVAYRESANTLEALLAEPPTARNRARFDSQLAEAQQARKLLAADIGRQTDARVEAATARWQETADNATRDLATELGAMSASLAKTIDAAMRSDSAVEFAASRAQATSLYSEINDLLASHSYLPNADALRRATVAADSRLKAIATKWTALEGELAGLDNATESPAYIEALERIHSFDILPPADKSNIEQSLRLKADLGALRHKLLLPADPAARQALGTGGPYRSEMPQADEEERAFLQRLIDDPVFKNVYVSPVQYFEGGSEPRNEYKALLVEPVSKGDPSGESSDLSFSFRARGFDEQGEPETAAREINFVSRSDGTFWGFFYKPSMLCPESEYFENVIAKNLRAVLAGAPRLSLIKLFDQIGRESELAPAFRAYWQQRILELMSLRPWKWGMPLAPSLGNREAALRRAGGGEISKRLWLSSIEQTVPSFELAEYFEKDALGQAETEANAFAVLYEQALRGTFELVGRIRADGQQELTRRPLADEPLWTVDASTGEIARADSARRLAPYAPLLQYRFEDGGRAALLAKVRFLTGLDLSAQPYAPLLPALFR